MKNRTVRLGYEIGSGKPVEIPLRHMVVAGQTQEAGKTTTLEALISRAALPAVAFVTKRGERSFMEGRRIPPYFRERADWQFVASVLEATMRERLKFERAWIMRASKGARTLADVQHNVRTLAKTAKGLSADVYMTLDAYLDIVVPRIAAVKFATNLDLAPGLNVLDLSNRDQFPPELQSLVMRSVLEWVYERCDGTVTIIPEAWEFIPQGRASPVKLSAIELIRKGAGLRNFVWLDSQDIGGVDKETLRSCPVWLLGVQREANEIKRTLDNIPAGIAKPKPADVATLEKGQFFACFGKVVCKTYVQPAWMEPDVAIAIALGKADVDNYSHKPPTPSEPEHMSAAVEQKLDTLISLMMNQQRSELAPSSVSTQAAPPAPITSVTTSTADPSEEALYQRFKARLIEELPSDARLLQIVTSRPELRVEVERHVITADGESLRGRIGRLIADGFFEEARTNSNVIEELGRKGFSTAPPNVSRELADLTAMGFFTKDNKWYRAVSSMKVNVVEK